MTPLLWLFLSWGCSTDGCVPLPIIGPIPLSVCLEIRTGIVRQVPTIPFWIEGRCAVEGDV